MTTPTMTRTDFAARLFDKLIGAQPGKNLFLSPFSIQVALAMCAVGAKGETRKVMADLIGAPENVEEQNRQYSRLLRSINVKIGGPVRLIKANALWGQQGHRFSPAYRQAITDFYDGALNEVDFVTHPDEAMSAINAWASEETREKIKELIRRDFIDEATRLVLTNVIYFKGLWDEPFVKAGTVGEDWHGPGGTRKVPMMHQEGGYWYYESDALQALDLPYQGEHLSMLVVLPRQTAGLPALEARWAAEGTYQRVTAALRHEGTVLVSLPRFKMETELALKPVLCALGAERAFRDDADFSGIGEEPLKISEVVHKAFVEVNEEGTEAAAATAVGMAFCGILEAPQPKVFKADHPFLFFIRDRNTNVVLFAGRLLEPK
jgi:serpin B